MHARAPARPLAHTLARPPARPHARPSARPPARTLARTSTKTDPSSRSHRPPSSRALPYAQRRFPRSTRRQATHSDSTCVTRPDRCTVLSKEGGPPILLIASSPRSKSKHPRVELRCRVLSREGTCEHRSGPAMRSLAAAGWHHCAVNVRASEVSHVVSCIGTLLSVMI